MRRTLLTTLAAGIAVSLPLAVEAHPRHAIRDRIEDRIDRRESRIDERVDHGRWDVLEDRIDRWEDRRDRANLPVPGWVNRLERASWQRLWCQRFDNCPPPAEADGE